MHDALEGGLVKDAAEVVAALRAGLAPRGYDLIQPLRIAWYNALVEGPLRLDDLGSPEHLAVVVGNTRALWPRWLDALAADRELAAGPDPLDAYTERTLGEVVGALGLRTSVRFAHDAGERRVAMQRLAHVAGLAYLTETHTSVHPEYGPWIALRAVVSVAVPGPLPPATRLVHPCGGCEHACRPAFEHALSTLTGAPSQQNLRAHWRAWLAWRDACPVGRQHRYSDAQIRYHYCRQLVLPNACDVPEP